MVREARSIKHISTATELLALLLEDALIKKFLPLYNIKQKQFRDYQYLKLSTDRFPRLLRMTADTADSTGLYGPFRDRFFVDRLQEIFARYLGFRTCNDAQPSKRCIQLDLGQCLGPCVLPEVEVAYFSACQAVEGFLRGEDPGVVPLILTEIRNSIESLNFEHAQRLRDDLVFCDAFFNRQRFNHRFRVETLQVHTRLSSTPAYYFEKGALREIVLKDGRISRPGEQLDLFDLSVCREDDPRFLLDRANLVYNWLNRNSETVDYSFGTSP